MRLTAQQLLFFNTFGYLAFPGLLSDAIGDIAGEFERVWAQQGGGHHGKTHDGKARSCLVPFIDQSTRLSTLLDDQRIHEIATSLVGDDFNYMGSDGNYYAGDTAWHSDGSHGLGDPLHIKFAFYLDPLTRDSGALRVMPGSHQVGDGFANALHGICHPDPITAVGLHGRDLPAIALETVPGDVLVFNHNIKHSSWNGNGRRRMFTINLCQRYPEHRLQDLRDYISGYARFQIDRTHGPIMVETAGPQRRRHLQQVRENDLHLADLARKARETMLEPSRG